MASWVRAFSQQISRCAPPRLLLAALCLLTLPILLMPFALAEDRALIWQRVENWPGDHQVQQIAAGSGASPITYAVSRVGGLYISWDDASHWSHSTLPVPDGRFDVVRVLDIAIHPLDSRTAFVIVASPSGKPRPMVYQTRDGGLNWRAESGLGATRISALSYDAAGEALYLATPSELFQALVQKGQETVFAPSLAELRQGYLTSLEADHPVLAFASARWSTADAGYLYVGTKGGGLGAFTLQDGKAEPVPVAQGNVSQYVRDKAQVYAVCAHALRPGFVCVATEQGLYASMDGGVSWFLTASVLREGVSALLMDPQEDVIYAGLAGGGVYTSRDSGATWNRLGKGLSSLFVYDLAFVTDLTGQRVLLAATSDGLWRLPLSSA